MKKIFTITLLTLLLSNLASAFATDMHGDRRVRDKVLMCIGCHGITGYRTAFPQVYRVPKLGGQNAAYLETALHAYKQGKRKHATMQAIAAALSEQDIADLAAYYATQARAVSHHQD